MESNSRSLRKLTPTALIPLALLAVGGTAFQLSRVSAPAAQTPRTNSVSYTPVTDSPASDGNGAVYLRVAKSLMSVGDDQSALRFLEKAASLNSPSQKEAAELLTQAVAAQRGGQDAGAPSYDPSMSPADVVRGY